MSENEDQRYAYALIGLLTKALLDIDTILKKPASNRQFMQIAEPARRCRNIIKALNITKEKHD